MDGTQSIRTYSFPENGYTADVSCMHNTTAEWRLPSDDGGCDAYDKSSAAGALPNNNTGSPEVITMPELCHDTSRMMLMAGRMLNHRTVIALAANSTSGPYSILDNIQCELFFRPTAFEVAVDTDKHLVNVTATSDEVRDIDPSAADYGGGFGVVASMAIQLVASMSQTYGVYDSAVADTFLANINNTAAALNTSITDPKTVTRAIENSMKSLVDDTLLAYSSAQLMIAGGLHPGEEQD